MWQVTYQMIVFPCFDSPLPHFPTNCLQTFQVSIIAYFKEVCQILNPNSNGKVVELGALVGESSKKTQVWLLLS